MQQEKCILAQEHDCLGRIKARELEKDMNELHKQNSATHERIYERLNELEKQEGIQNVQYENILEKLDQLSGDVNELKTKPAKRWESILEKVIGLFAAGLVGYVLAQIGLS